jgi:hypothetical protein
MEKSILCTKVRKKPRLINFSCCKLLAHSKETELFISAQYGNIQHI